MMIYIPFILFKSNQTWFEKYKGLFICKWAGLVRWDDPLRWDHTFFKKILINHSVLISKVSQPIGLTWFCRRIPLSRTWRLLNSLSSPLETLRCITGSSPPSWVQALPKCGSNELNWFKWRKTFNSNART